MDLLKLESLTGDGVISRLLYREEVTSTNDMIMEIARQGYPEKALALCEIQTAGRGRKGRHWESPAGSGIWMSLLLHPQRKDLLLSSITLLAALAITRSINEELLEMGFADSSQTLRNNADTKTSSSSILNAQIKWPNDVIVGSKKVCGILTEMISDGTNNNIIVGIGINVNQTAFPEELLEKGISLAMATGRQWNRESLVVRVIKHLVLLEDEFENVGDLSPFLEEYNSLLISKDKEVVLTADNIDFPDNPYTARGITKTGALIVEDKMGKSHDISFGEVSVRGLLGYV